MNLDDLARLRQNPPQPTAFSAALASSAVRAAGGHLTMVRNLSIVAVTVTVAVVAVVIGLLNQSNDRAEDPLRPSASVAAGPSGAVSPLPSAAPIPPSRGTTSPPATSAARPSTAASPAQSTASAAPTAGGSRLPAPTYAPLPPRPTATAPATTQAPTTVAPTTQAPTTVASTTEPTASLTQPTPTPSGSVPTTSPIDPSATPTGSTPTPTNPTPPPTSSTPPPSSITPTSPAPSSPAPTPSATSPTPLPVNECTAAQVEHEGGSAVNIDGRVTAQFVLRNTGTGPCLLTGELRGQLVVSGEGQATFQFEPVGINHEIAAGATALVSFSYGVPRDCTPPPAQLSMRLGTIGPFRMTSYAMQCSAT